MFVYVDTGAMASTSNLSCSLCSNAVHLTLDFNGLVKHLSLFVTATKSKIYAMVG